ncbi:amino acid ABC transporter substrate-binding protein [Falsiroseomonas sp. HW251]|uniref:amino acid ABC transporter substrate-binding protein n=1 Tax=Falsiroseomonas sp. HW251 TaxID=3390998 RepID=UPI003D31E8BF
MTPMRSLLLAAAACLGLGIAEAAAQVAPQLDTIRQRNVFRCGVYENVPGLSALDARGNRVGFDVDYCRAMAAAILGDANKVEFRTMTLAQGIPALRSGEVDMVALAITYTIQRDTELGLDFVGPTLFSGQAFMVHRRTGAQRLTDLNGATICLVAGGITDSLIADYFRARNMTFRPLAVENTTQMYTLYEEGRCDVVTSEVPFLGMRRSRLRQPDQHLILNEIFAKSHMGPVIRDDDRRFAHVARWVHYALVNAEEMGITQANVSQMLESRDPAIRRFLGLEGDIGRNMGLPNDFTVTVIRSVGNYGEIFERHYGMASEIKLPRGLNALAENGGLQWSPTWR